MKRLIVLYHFLCFVAVAFSQNGDFTLENYTSEQGLSHNFSDCIIQDNVGFIWVGTHNGLNRFDGHKFKTFLNDTSDKESLVSVHIVSLLKDRKGTIWVGTVYGLDKFDSRREKFVHISDYPGCSQLKAIQIKFLLEDYSGKIWIGTYGKGLFLLNPITMEIEAEYRQSNNANGLSSDFINTLYQESSDELWIGTWGGGLNRLHISSGKVDKYENVENFVSEESSTINSITSGPDGNLLLGTWLCGVCIFDRKDEVVRRYNLINNAQILENEAVISIKHDRAGRYWISTFNQGIFVYEPHTKSLKNFRNEARQPFFIKANMTWSIFEDNYGVIWVSTYGGGIIKLVFPQSSFRQIVNKGSEHPTALVNCIFEGSGQNTWIGTQSNGLYTFNNKKQKIEYYIDPISKNNPVPRNSVKCITADRFDNLWIGLDRGLCKYEHSTGLVEHYSPNLLSNDTSFKSKNIGVTSLCFDTTGYLWIGTFDAGVYRLNTADMSCDFFRFEENNPKSLSSNIIWSIACDKQNNVWLGTRNMLNRFDQKNCNFIHYPPDPQKSGMISHHVISQVYFDSGGRIWVATLGGGVNLYRSGTNDFLTINTSMGLPDNTIYSLIDDKNGNLWFSSAKGLSRYNPSTNQLNNYNKSNGINDISFNIGASWNSNSGTVFFGGNNGLTIFHPDSIYEFTESPKVVFTGFKMFNKEVSVGQLIDKRVILKTSINETKEIELHYSDNNIAFEFAVLDFASPNINLYAYQLEGFDKDWVITNASQRFANYTNLAPGSYTFKVKATNHNGIWSKNAKSIVLIIKPPFYKTIWFILLVIFISVSLILYFIYYRINHFEKQREALQKMVDKQTAEIKKKNEYLEYTNSELSKQKEEISIQNTAISLMNERIKEADNKKTLFFTNISHEIRTPLTLIIGPLENVIEKTAVGDPRYTQLLMAQKNANRLLKLINELLDFSKIDIGSMELSLIDVDVVKFTSDIFSLFSMAALDKKFEFIFNSSHQSAIASIDTSKMEIILLNIISNAYKYTREEGKISLDLQIDEKEEQLVFKIEDTGIGIPKNRLAKIFDRYYQIESTNYKAQGSGIGLALTKELVELMNGGLSVTSELDKGSCFTIKIPFIKPSENELSPGSDFNYSINNKLLDQYLPSELLPGPKMAENTNGLYKLLIIDDNSDLRNYIKSCFEGKYQILEAKNGLEGLEMAGNLFPNLIISDIMMPEMDGIELCRRIKSNFATSHVPVILLTARSGVNEQIEGLETGADDYIIKPFNKEVLLLKVNNLIVAREKLRGLFSSKMSIEPHEITVTSADEKFIAHALSIVEKNIDDPSFGAAGLVSELGVSRTLAHMKFKELTQTSTSEFIKTIRLKRACQLLKMNKLRVSEVGYKVGFSDPQYFTKSFKNYFGITPTEFAEKTED